MNFFKKLLCRHNDFYMIRWHFTHGPNDNDPRFIEYEVECQKCGKRMFAFTKDPDYIEYITESYGGLFDP